MSDPSNCALQILWNVNRFSALQNCNMTLHEQNVWKNIISLHALGNHTTITLVTLQTRLSLKCPLNKTASTFFSVFDFKKQTSKLFASKYILLEQMKEKVFEKTYIEKRIE